MRLSELSLHMKRENGKHLHSQLIIINSLLNRFATKILKTAVPEPSLVKQLGVPQCNFIKIPKNRSVASAKIRVRELNYGVSEKSESLLGVFIPVLLL